MKKLTPKQITFCDAIVRGKSQTEAYKEAYNCDNMKDSTIHNNAYMLMQRSEIKERIKELRQSLEAVSVWNRADSVKALISILQDEKTKPNEKIQAIKELNTMHGYNQPSERETPKQESLKIVWV